MVSSSVKNYIQRNGFVMVSNLLVDHQQELGITENEFNFIVKVLRFKNLSSIHDKELDSTVSAKTLSRRRASLKQKGLLNFTVIKTQDPENGQFKTDGINYDFSPLEEKLQAISDKIEEKKQKKLQEKLIKENKIEEPVEYDSPIESYREDFKEHYGVEYILNPYEIKKYNQLSNDDKLLIPYIFDYCQARKILDKVVPRLSLFFKAKFRFDDLRKFCNGDFKESSKKNTQSIDSFIEDKFKEYYPTGDNFAFYSKLETLIYSNCGDDLIITPRVKMLLDQAYKDTLQFRIL